MFECLPFVALWFKEAKLFAEPGGKLVMDKPLLLLTFVKSSLLTPFPVLAPLLTPIISAEDKGLFAAVLCIDGNCVDVFVLDGSGFVYTGVIVNCRLLFVVLWLGVVEVWKQKNVVNWPAEQVSILSQRMV